MSSRDGVIGQVVTPVMAGSGLPRSSNFSIARCECKCSLSADLHFELDVSAEKLDAHIAVLKHGFNTAYLRSHAADCQSMRV